MLIAVYNENTSEWNTLRSHLQQCAAELLKTIHTEFYCDYGAFLQAINRGGQDILLITQNGTFSLEIMEAVKAHTPDTPVIWFSDLDFAVRSYEYGVAWFGRKPVELAKLRKAFARVCKNST